MNKLSLLDCTLRDGGYINDWEFGATTIANVYSRLNASGIDYIELGFINESYKFDINRTITPNTKYLNKIFAIKAEKKAKLLAMIIIGECSIDGVGQKEETLIDGLRIVFKKSGINDAFEFAEKCKNKGYDIFFQPASITDYSDEEMKALVEKANKFKPIAFYMVDTYGLLNKQRMFHYADIIDKYLDKDILIGYHSHNNFQLSYATAMEFIEKDIKHDIIVDCTLYGMGKTTGNLNTELIVDYVNKEKNGKYDNDQILEAIDSEIMKIRQQYSWGYSINGFLAASNDCHPKYVQYLLERKSLSIASINIILKKIDKDNLTTFNKSLIEKLFFEYQSVEVNDSASVAELTKLFCGRKILLLATGASLNKEYEKIQTYIKENNPIIISINHNPEKFKIDYCFISNSKRFAQMSLFINNNINEKLITTSNIIGSSRKIEYVINYANLLVDGDINIISDNATLMFFKLLKICGIKKVDVAGFDGFKCFSSENYVDNYLSYNTNTNVELQNQLIRDALLKFRKEMEISLITKSYYEDKND